LFIDWERDQCRLTIGALGHPVSGFDTHGIGALLDGLPAGVEAPLAVDDAASFTTNAVSARNPGDPEQIDSAAHEEAVRLSRAVLEWAESILRSHGH